MQIITGNEIHDHTGNTITKYCICNNPLIQQTNHLGREFFFYNFAICNGARLTVWHLSDSPVPS